jgi:hypothetical protein
MPLSEHEQKILTDLEESLFRQDPRFAKKVSNGNFYTRRHRRALGAVGFVVGLAIMVAFFTQSLTLGLIGLAVMIGSSLVFACSGAEARNEALSPSE